MLPDAAFDEAVLVTAELDLYLEAARRWRVVVNFFHCSGANRPS